MYEYNDEITLFPNPSRGQFTLTGLKTASIIEVYNCIGQKLQNIIDDASNTMIIDISNKPAGIYFIRINNQNKENFKIMKVFKE